MIWRRVTTWVRQLVCGVDQHGPFGITAMSTADSGGPPIILCQHCGADASHLFEQRKVQGRIFIRNDRRSPAILRNPLGEPANAWIVQPGATLTYSAGEAWFGV